MENELISILEEQINEDISSVKKIINEREKSSGELIKNYERLLRNKQQAEEEINSNGVGKEEAEVDLIKINEELNNINIKRESIKKEVYDEISKKKRDLTRAKNLVDRNKETTEEIAKIDIDINTLLKHKEEAEKELNKNGAGKEEAEADLIKIQKELTDKQNLKQEKNNIIESYKRKIENLISKYNIEDITKKREEIKKDQEKTEQQERRNKAENEIINELGYAGYIRWMEKSAKVVVDNEEERKEIKELLDLRRVHFLELKGDKFEKYTEFKNKALDLYLKGELDLSEMQIEQQEIELESEPNLEENSEAEAESEPKPESDLDLIKDQGQDLLKPEQKPTQIPIQEPTQRPIPPQQLKPITPQPIPQPQPKPETEFKLGKTASIAMADKVYTFDTKQVKQAMNKSYNEISAMLDNYLIGDEKALIQKLITKNEFDPTILAIINDAGAIYPNEKQKLVKQYVDKCLDPKEKSELKIEYDTKELSKVNLFNRIFKRELNSQEKYKMIIRASAAQSKDIAEVDGEYKIGAMEKFISKFTRKQPMALPTRAEIEAAYAYNENIYGKNRKEFKDSMKIAKEQISKDGYKELNKFAKKQNKEESKKYFKDEEIEEIDLFAVEEDSGQDSQEL